MPVNYDQVIQILQRLLDQANDVEAEVGTSPTAQEALSWAIDEITALNHSA